MVKKTQKSLDAEAPEQDLSTRINNLEARIGPMKVDIEQLQDQVSAQSAGIGQVGSDIQKVWERIDAAKEIVDKINSEFEQALNAMAEVRQLQALQDIVTAIRELKGYVPVSPSVETGTPGEPSTPPDSPSDKVIGVVNALRNAGLDVSLIYIEQDGPFITVIPKKFLGDLWGGFNTALTSAGYKWIRDGRESRWSNGEGQPRSPPQSSAGFDPGWKEMKGGKGFWAYSDRFPREFVERINATEKRKLEEGGFTYTLYGDINPNTGFPKCVGRFGKGR